MPTNLKEPGGGELADLTLNVRNRILCRVWVDIVVSPLDSKTDVGIWMCCMLNAILFSCPFKGVANKSSCINIMLILCRAHEAQSPVQVQILRIHQVHGEREIHQNKAHPVSASFKPDNSNMKRIRPYSSQTQCHYQCPAISVSSYHLHHQKWISTAC